jgi:hypothetical protein
MLIPVLMAKTQYNLRNAREYFEEHLCADDYYDEGQCAAGHVKLRPAVRRAETVVRRWRDGGNAAGAQRRRRTADGSTADSSAC